MIPHKWKFIGRLGNGGHKLYLDEERSRFAIADESGTTPDQTDDGVLWIVTHQRLEVKEGAGFDRSASCSVKVNVDKDGGNVSYFSTTLDGALLLAHYAPETVDRLIFVTRDGRKFRVPGMNLWPEENRRTG